MAQAVGGDMMTTKQGVRGPAALAPSLIRLNNIVKTFAGTAANDGVDTRR